MNDEYVHRDWTGSTFRDTILKDKDVSMIGIEASFFESY